MKHTNHLLALAVILLLPITCVSAASIFVEKNISSGPIRTGDDVKISLIITNPFGSELPIKIVDKNIFGNNGLDIQCLEYIVPANRAVELGYEPIKAYAAGNHSLGEAKITYINPDSGKEENVYTKQINISITGAASGQASGITAIYKCNGVNMQSTSFSSSAQSQQQSRQEKQDQDDMQKKVQNNQMNQNTQALKQEVAEQKKTEEEFQKNLENNPDFKKKDEELKQGGYVPQPKESRQNPSSNDSGSFERKYKKPSGEQASMKGEMENKEIKNLSAEFQDSPEKMMQALQNNPTFQNMSESLKAQGFNQSSPEFSSLGNNKTKINIPFNDSRGRQKNITAEYRKGNITSVRIGGEKKEEEKDYLPKIIAFIVLIAAAILLYKKFMKKKTVRNEFEAEKIGRTPIDYRQAAKHMLTEAEKLFAQGNEKDAYEKVSQAVRYYYSMKLEAGKELNATDLISLLKNKCIEYSLPQKCLSLCGMVEFAKYKPNKEDFGEIMKFAREIIV